jgi:hypothetical protein
MFHLGPLPKGLPAFCRPTRRTQLEQLSRFYRLNRYLISSLGFPTTAKLMIHRGFNHPFSYFDREFNDYLVCEP